MTHTIVWNQLAERKPDDLARCSGARIVSDGLYEIPALNQTYRVDVTSRTISPLDTTSPLLVNHLGVALLNYLTNAKDINLTGEWVNPRHLPGGDNFFKGPHDVPVAGLMERFGEDKKGFQLASERLAGHPLAYADSAYSFLFFPRLPVSVLLWLKDDEFPARVSVLVDRTASQHLALDALLGVFHVLQQALFMV